MVMKESTWLLEFKRDYYSQTGEDGIIEKIFEILPNNDDPWCVEFGAWDGVHLTNTRHLIESKGFSAVLIEADKRRFADLRRNYSQYGERIVPINRVVGFGDDDNLDTILVDTPIPLDFDFLSIDIDGNDYHVWNRVRKYSPKAVVIEFNQTIPTHIRFVQPADSSVNQGASLAALVELGQTKGYELISVLPNNAFFVRKEYFHLFQIESNAPEVLRTKTGSITYLFTGYDGRVFLHGARRLPWHRIELVESDMQTLPRFLRTFPGKYSAVQKFVFNMFILLKQPRRFLQRMTNK